MRRKLLLFTVLCMSLLLLSCGAEETPDKGAAAPEVSISYVSFDDLAPEGYLLTASWNAMGIDEYDNVYIGFTSYRMLDRKEDVVVFSYNRDSGDRKFLGTFMRAAEDAGNLRDGEEMPKGHTKMIYADGMVYMASQSFHDFKGPLNGLKSMRGAHLFRYDLETGAFADISARLPGGVVVENEGIIEMDYMPSMGYLVGLTHPHSNIVLFDIAANEVVKIVPGIPWEPGKPVSRDLVVDDQNQKVFIYRGPENAVKYADMGHPLAPVYIQYDKNTLSPIYVYDLASDALTQTGYSVKGGLWTGAQISPDGNTAYISTVAGDIVALDLTSGAAQTAGSFLPAEFDSEGIHIEYLYHMTMSADGAKLYALPTYMGSAGGLYAFDTASGQAELIQEMPNGVYCGNGVRDSEGYLYFAVFGVFGSEGQWSGDCQLVIIKV